MEMVEAAIMGVVQPIALVGTAVLLILVALRVLMWVRASFDEEAERQAFHDEFMRSVEDDPDHISHMSLADLGHEFLYTCDACGINSVDDIWYFYDRETGDPLGDDLSGCPECGGPIRTET